MENRKLIEKLEHSNRLEGQEWEQLFATYTEKDLEFASAIAREIAVRRFGKKIYFRGIIEFTNICGSDCLHCGIRRSNHKVSRYRLEPDDILKCCREGYENGFRTFVLQGGEDPFYNDEQMCGIISGIKHLYPDCAITLSIGERSRESYQALYDAGADRYLLRHETAEEEHYAKLHPENQSFENRMRCLKELKEIGYQTGCGMMVGTPHQTPKGLASDMLFLSEFRPEMVGIGPFLPHKDTPFREEPHGSVRTTLFALALSRILLPQALLPSTTALGTVEADGRQRGVLSGCNVIMPNLSPLKVREKYMLYDNKIGTDLTAAQSIASLRKQMEEIGYEVVIGRGDFGEEGTL